MPTCGDREGGFAVCPHSDLSIFFVGFVLGLHSRAGSFCAARPAMHSPADRGHGANRKRCDEKATGQSFRRRLWFGRWVGLGGGHRHTDGRAG